MKARLPLVLCAIAALIACGVDASEDLNAVASRLQEAWNPINDPLRLGADYERRLDALPLSGQLARSPWVDDYWPSHKSGIAHRWLSDHPRDFAYAPPSKELLARMSLRERAELSPAEKYDALRGEFSYPLVNSERQRVSPDDASWEGLCHGWAAASLRFDEPNSVLARNPDGIEIPFGASDIKALLIYLQGVVENPPFRMLGARCNVKPESPEEASRRPECLDVNAGAFHVILANFIGIRKQGFIFDVQHDFEVWNHPVSSYEAALAGERAPSAGAAPDAVKEVLVEARVGYAREVSSRWLARGEEGNADAVSFAHYRYALELDASGRIVGGAWQGPARPDFLWVQDAAPFQGAFAALGELYEKSRAQESAFPEPESDIESVAR